jgi:hypothetical protein
MRIKEPMQQDTRLEGRHIIYHMPRILTNSVKQDEISIFSSWVDLSSFLLFNLEDADGQASVRCNQKKIPGQVK